MVTSDEAGTRRVLDDGKWKYRTFGVTEASIANRPGALAEVARKLGKAGVNVEAAFPTGTVGGTVHLAFATDNPTKAREALGDSLVPPPARRSQGPSARRPGPGAPGSSRGSAVTGELPTIEAPAPAFACPGIGAG